MSRSFLRLNKKIRTPNFEKHNPWLWDAVGSPLRNGTGRQAAHFGDFRSAAECINEGICIHDLRILEH